MDSMSALHIRDLPEDVVDALKRRAKRHNRSLQGELRQILVTEASKEPSGEPYPPLQLHFAEVAEPAGSWSREDIYGDDGR